MSTVISKQIEAFGDAVTTASAEAMLCRDVDDLVLTGRHVVHIASDWAARHRARGTLDPAQAAEYFRTLLSFTTSAQALVQKMRLHGFTVDPEDELSHAVLEVRRLLVESLDSRPPESVTQSLSYTDAASAAKSNPPPQSWFDEDTRGLRGNEI